MSYALFGVANHSIFDFAQNLKGWVEEAELDAKPFRPTLLGFDEWPDEIRGVVLVPTVSLFLQRRAVLEKAKAVVFVFDTAVLLEYLPSVEILDLLEKRQSYVYRYRPLSGAEVVSKIVKAREDREHVEVSEQDVQVIPNLLGETKSSLLNPILNFLYSVKDTNRRHDYQRAIYGWMRTGSDLSGLTEQLPNGKATQKLCEFIESDVGVATLTAVREMVSMKAAGKQVNVDKLAKKHDLSAFDLRYLQATMQKAEPVVPSGAKAAADEEDCEED